MILETENGRVKGKYVRGASLIAQVIDLSLFYYLLNAHGDVIQRVGANGEATPQYKYDAFGNQRDEVDTDPNPFRYCGEYWDSHTEEYYFRERTYTPSNGRFTSKDSIDNVIMVDENAERPSIDPLSLNYYTYAHNNPIQKKDLTGTFAIAAGAVIGAMVFGGILGAIGGVASAITNGEDPFYAAAGGFAAGAFTAAGTIGGTIVGSVASTVLAPVGGAIGGIVGGVAGAIGGAVSGYQKAGGGILGVIGATAGLVGGAVSGASAGAAQGASITSAICVTGGTIIGGGLSGGIAGAINDIHQQLYNYQKVDWGRVGDTFISSTFFGALSSKASSGVSVVLTGVEIVVNNIEKWLSPNSAQSSSTTSTISTNGYSTSTGNTKNSWDNTYSTGNVSSTPGTKQNLRFGRASG